MHAKLLARIVPGLIAFLLIPASVVIHAQDASPLCADYDTQEAAQSAFEGDPERFEVLDDDNDGVACEHLPSADVAGNGSVVAWVAAGVVTAGAIAGAAFRLKRRSAPEPGAPPDDESPAPGPEVDDALEMELELIKAERVRRVNPLPGEKRPPDPDTPGTGGPDTRDATG